MKQIWRLNQTLEQNETTSTTMMSLDMTLRKHAYLNILKSLPPKMKIFR